MLYCYIYITNIIIFVVKVNKKLKRLRMNQRLRKTLQPKNAIMVLNEMKAGVQFTFPETQGPMTNSLYLVHAEVILETICTNLHNFAHYVIVLSL